MKAKKVYTKAGLLREVEALQRKVKALEGAVKRQRKTIGKLSWKLKFLRSWGK